MYRILSGFALLLVTAYVQGTTEGRLLSQSSSGHTAVFNLGIHDGIVEGDYAVIVKEIRDLQSRDLRFIPAAKARNIRISTDSSIWVLYHIYDPKLMVNGQKYVVLSESRMLRGRKNPEIGRTTVVAPRNKISASVKSALADDKDRLGKLKDDYQLIDHTHEKEIRSDHDFELIELDEWKKSKRKRYRSALYRGPNKDEFRRARRLDIFEKLVAAYLMKVNNPDFNYDKFYADQMRDGFSNEFRQKTNFSTEYEDFLHNQSLKASADAKLYRSVLEKGGSWSEDFSDEELRKVLKSVSVLQEADRRTTVVSKPLRYLLGLEMGLILNDSQTDRDTSYRRENLREFAADFEMTPFLKHETLERFTLNATVRSTRSAFDNEGSNVDFDNLSLSVGANWYPLYAPYTVKAPLFFIGTYVRSGFGTVTSPLTGEVAKYSVLSFPGLRGGVRYNIKSNIGLRIVASMETLKLERYEVSKLGSALPETEALLEGKMGLGLSYSF